MTSRLLKFILNFKMSLRVWRSRRGTSFYRIEQTDSFEGLQHSANAPMPPLREQSILYFSNLCQWKPFIGCKSLWQIFSCGIPETQGLGVFVIQTVFILSLNRCLQNLPHLQSKFLVSVHRLLRWINHEWYLDACRSYLPFCRSCTRMSSYRHISISSLM